MKAKHPRALVSDSTLSAARSRGRLGGRPKGLPKKAEATACAVETLYQEGKLTVRQIAEKLSISKATLYAYLRHREVEISNYTKPSKLTT